MGGVFLLVEMEQATDFLTSEKFSMYRNVLSVLGAAYLLKVMIGNAWSLAGGFCAHFLAPWGISRIDIRKYGSWASTLLIIVLYRCILPYLCSCYWSIRRDWASICIGGRQLSSTCMYSIGQSWKLPSIFPMTGVQNIQSL